MPRNRIISYNPKLKPMARALRQETTESEKTGGMLLRKKQWGYEFVTIDNFIVEFYGHELSLAMAGAMTCLKPKKMIKTDRRR